MNTKTTLLLFVLVVALGAMIVLLKEKAPPPAPAIPDAGPSAAAQAQQKLFKDDDFGEAAEIDVAQEGLKPWRFVKTGAGTEAHWEITEPVTGKAQKWQVEQIANRLSRLDYVAKYEGATAHVTPASVGLEPPRAVITLINKDGEKRIVQIGRNEGDSESYVRLEGSEAIYRVKPSLKTLLKKKPLEYLDQQLFDLSANDIVQLSITAPDAEGVPETYTLVKTGTDWRFAAPAPARAMAKAVQTLCSTFANLRAMAWVEDHVTDPKVFGLGEGAVHVTVTAQVTPAADADTNGEGKEATPAPVTKTYAVTFSKISPLGDKNKVYLRRGEETLVGTVMKSVADKFLPNLKAWRDNRLVQRDPALARKLTIAAGGKETTFLRGGARWSYEAGGAPADDEEIRRLLGALNNARALNFVAGAKEKPAAFGLDAPRAVLTLTFDDEGEPTRVAVGGFADPRTKRIAYIQTDGSDTVAKVRVADADALVRRPEDFRDRTVLAIPADRLREITIKRAAGKAATEPAVAFTLANTNGLWSMTQPVAGAVDKGKVAKLVALLGGLRARKIIDLDAGADLATYELDAPEVTLSYTHLPPKVYQMRTRDAGTNGESPTKVTPVQPPAETGGLRVARHGGKTYLQRDDNPGVVYEVEPAVLATLTAEFRSAELFNFKPAQVSRVSLTANGFTQGFRKTDAGWQYEPEADLPVDGKKITNYLLRIKDLKITRVVSYDADDLAHYGLDQPAYELTVEVGGAALPALHISAKTADGEQPFARAANANVVFLLPKDAVNRIVIDVAEFEAP